MDIDLEKFFDKVPQNKLMSLVHHIMLNELDKELEKRGLRLLYGTTCFQVMLNRRMPNGMYGGGWCERGEKISAYSILKIKTKGVSR